MGDLYPLWAAGSLSDEERASLRERVESAPERPPEAPPKSPEELEREQLRSGAEAVLYFYRQTIEREGLHEEPELAIAFSHLRMALSEGRLVGLEASIRVAEVVFRRSVPLLRRVKALPSSRRHLVEQLLSMLPPQRSAWGLKDARIRATVLLSTLMGSEDGQVESLPERLAVLATTMKSEDTVNVLMAVEAVEDALALADSPAPGDLPPAAEARLAVPRSVGQ